MKGEKARKPKPSILTLETTFFSSPLDEELELDEFELLVLPLNIQA
jgi:hypothetical protein